MKNKIEISAPGKLMLFGEHAVVYGGPCIVTAVNQRMRVVVETTKDREIELKAPEVGLKHFKDSVSASLDRLPKGARFVFSAVKNFNGRFELLSGLRIRTNSDFSNEFGFGSSSSVTVCVAKALSAIFDVDLDNKELFDICYKSVLDVQGVGSGFDIAAAVWGGTLYFVGGGKKIAQVSKKELPLVVGYTGIKADTATLVKEVAFLKKSKPRIVSSIFRTIDFIVGDARRLIVNGNFKRLGELANINQGLLDSLGVNTTKLSNLIIAAKDAGAYGAKLSGAGGGDCMIAFVPERKRKFVEKAIEKAGGKVISVKNGAEGVRIEK